MVWKAVLGTAVTDPQRFLTLRITNLHLVIAKKMFKNVDHFDQVIESLIL